MDIELRSTRSSSTTTRIKTKSLWNLSIKSSGTRSSSTTTRIKTTRSLKCFAMPFIRTRSSSTTTRIKTILLSAVERLLSVRDHLPLQQGLRLNITNYILISNIVRDHLPLQQGLRHKLTFGIECCDVSTRSSSTTTRIKTLVTL